MNKQLTPLKALDHIKTYARLDACKRCQYFKNCNCENNIGECIWKDEINIIETALKEYEKYVNTPALFCGMERGKTQKIIDELSHHKEVKITNLIDERKVRAFEIIKEHITSISFKYGGILGNVIKLKIDCDTCYIHFNENDKNFDLLKEELK